jgi:hypothetical protein
MQSIANNYFLSVACSTAAWFVVKASCRFVFNRYSSAYRGGLPAASSSKQRTPAIETKQQQDAAIKKNQRRFLTYVVCHQPWQNFPALVLTQLSVLMRVHIVALF